MSRQPAFPSAFFERSAKFIGKRLDGTPLLDIKPYLPRFDCRDGATSGWLAENQSRLESARDGGCDSGGRAIPGKAIHPEDP